MQVIEISEVELDALARTTMSEVGHFGRYGETVLEGGVGAVIDTILNRVAHPSFPDSVEEVVNAAFQFSAIGGPGGVKTWRRLAKASSVVTAVVTKHLEERLDGRASTVEGAMHFLNPNFSSPRALKGWGNHVVKHAIAIWGKGQDVHFHGYAPQSGPPPAYGLGMDGKAREFTGKGEDASTGASKDREIASDGAGSKAGDVTISEPDRDDTLAYCVEEVAAADATSVQAALNRRSAEGWRLHKFLPFQDRLLIVFEGNDADDVLHEADDRGDEAPAAPVVVTDDTPEALFAKFLGALKLRNFEPHEFLVLGGQNFLDGPAKGKNTLPPEELWENIKPTAELLDELRAVLGARIRLSSIYRSPAYNALIPGAASGSVHMEFRAADFTCDDGQGPVGWAKRLKHLRDQGAFRGGIGVYPTFVHVDTRGQNVKFGPWLNRAFG